MKSKKILVLILVFSMIILSFGDSVKANVKSEVKESFDLSKVVDFRYEKDDKETFYISDYSEEVQIHVGDHLKFTDLYLEVTSNRKKASKETYFVFNKKNYEKSGYYLETVKAVNRVTKKAHSVQVGVLVLEKGDSEYHYLETLSYENSGDIKDKVVVRSRNIRNLSKPKIMYAETAVLLRSVPRVSGLHYGKILDRVWYGHKVKVLGLGRAECGNTDIWWYKISYKGKVGYVDAMWFSEKKPKIYKGKDISYSNGNPERIIKHKGGWIEVETLVNGFWADNNEDFDEGYYCS